ncbi:hypothetical protein D9756_008991 [Leucocoprinus leucothites]|uniref:HMG box domain-containing protein n=1 Tax=Leucocoprinus leucothites TaxID=201217 RepID=A0A8H5FTU6_9AGAR|nr:hypothetical protein D9756_008991 [Leucoagaricus leucothites]
MLPAHAQPLGWTPLVDEDFQHVDSMDTYQGYSRSVSPLSTSSSYSDNDQNHPRNTSNNRRQHDPAWVARPRNAFIIFRCEYSQIHCRQGPRIRRPPGTSTEPTLSKRAAIAWSQMSSEEKAPYKIRAEKERTDHAHKYPEYRFRPQRRPSPNRRRYSLRPSTTNTFPYTGINHDDSEILTAPFTPFGDPNSRPSTSDGLSMDVNPESPSSDWTLLPSHEALDVESGEIKLALKSAEAHRSSYFSSDTSGSWSWYDSPPGPIPRAEFVEPYYHYLDQSTFSLDNMDTDVVTDRSLSQYQQYSDTGLVWPSHIPADYSDFSSSEEMLDVLDSPNANDSCLQQQSITISTFTTLGNAVLGIV